MVPPSPVNSTRDPVLTSLLTDKMGIETFAFCQVISGSSTPSIVVVFKFTLPS